MYQYRAVLKSTNEIIAEGHTLEEVENLILHFRRQSKKGEHTRSNDKIDIFHLERNKLFGGGKLKLIKTV